MTKCLRIGVRAWRFTPLLIAMLFAGCDKLPVSTSDSQPTPLANSVSTPTVLPKAAPSAEPVVALPDFGRSERVKTEAVGYGPTLPEAVDAALLLAIKQVNGETIDASMHSVQQAIAIGIGDDAVKISSAGFAQDVATRSRGAVTNFKLVAHEQNPDDKQFKAVVNASVAKFKQPESASLPRLIVAPFQVTESNPVIDRERLNGEKLRTNLQQSVTASLNGSNRFTVLDRTPNSDIDAEMAFIDSGAVTKADFDRMGQALAADLILVGKIEKFRYERHERALKTSDRTLVSYSGGAKVSYQLLNVATRQIAVADSVIIALPDTEPTTLSRGVDASRISNDLQNQVGEAITQGVIRKFYPLSIASLSGDEAVLSQGASAFKAGGLYRVYVLGEEIRDPQTGRSLGRTESECCTVEVTRVTNDLAYGRLSARSSNTGAFVPGAWLVREQVAEVHSTTAPSPTAQAKPATPKPSTSVVPEDAAQNQNNDKDW